MVTYQLRDVLRCYPWLAPSTVSRRIYSGVFPVEHVPTRGCPQLFSFGELIHCAVIDDLAAFGLLGRYWNPINLGILKEGIEKCEKDDYNFFYLITIEFRYGERCFFLSIQDHDTQLPSSSAIVSVGQYYKIAQDILKRGENESRIR